MMLLGFRATGQAQASIFLMPVPILKKNWESLYDEGHLSARLGGAQSASQQMILGGSPKEMGNNWKEP